MDNKKIGKCRTCGEVYCMECSLNIVWDLYCSTKCEKNDEDNIHEEMGYPQNEGTIKI